MPTNPFTFQKESGLFLSRVNRFVTEVEVEGAITKAYLPNPGRLIELLLPGTELVLSPDISKGKLPYTVLACRKNKHHVLLHTHLTNKIVRHLLEKGLVSAFADYQVVRAEPVYKNHRFDLLLKNKNTAEKYYLEVKSTTLFEGPYAMFPDAVTARGTKHLLKLQELAQTGVKTGCLFVVMSPEAKFFLPAYSIDPLFAQTFLQVKDEVSLKALALGFDESFSQVDTIKEMTIPYGTFEEELRDGGYYLLLLRLDKKWQLEVGSLGKISFEEGYYVYAGSAKQGLSKRISRHKRKTKKKHWHIDYLTAVADKIEALSFVSTKDRECSLAAEVSAEAAGTVPKFGSSDCRCPAHLFYFAQNPTENLSFIKIIQKHRLLYPGQGRA